MPELELGLNYTPPGTNFSVTLASVRDVSLLVAVLKVAIGQAETAARAASNAVLRNGYTKQAKYLQECLNAIVGEQAAPSFLQ